MTNQALLMAALTAIANQALHNIHYAVQVHGDNGGNPQLLGKHVEIPFYLQEDLPQGPTERVADRVAAMLDPIAMRLNMPTGPRKWLPNASGLREEGDVVVEAHGFDIIVEAKAKPSKDGKGYDGRLYFHCVRANSSPE